MTLSQPYLIDGNDVRVNASIGVAFAEPGLGAGELLRNADLAMYRAKAGGKGRVELYRFQMQQDVAAARPSWPRACGRRCTTASSRCSTGRWSPWTDGRITSVCARAALALLPGGAVHLAEFLRVTEDGDKTAELDRWVLQEAVEQAAERAAAGLSSAVAIRIGARRLLDRSMPLGSVEALLTRHGLPPGSLVIELSDIDPRVGLDGAGPPAERPAEGSASASPWTASATATRRSPRSGASPWTSSKLDRGLIGGVVESARLHKITSGLLRIATDPG